MITKFTGKLNMPEVNMNENTYVLVKGMESFNLTAYLKEYRGFAIKLIIKYENEEVFNEIGVLEEYYYNFKIRNICIDDIIWNLTGETIEVIIDDLTEDVK